MSELQKKRLLQKKVGKQMKLYYFIMVIIYAVLSIVFTNRIIITAASLLPMFLMILSICQAVYFNNNRGKKDFNIINDSPVTEQEWGKVSVYKRNSYIIVAPLFLVFVLFFSTWIKLLSIILYLFGFAGGMLYYRIQHRDVISNRFAEEESELKKQQELEELGRWK